MNLLLEALNNALNKCVTENINEDTYADWAKRDALDTMVNSYENGDNDSELKKHLTRVGNHIGVRMPKLDKTRTYDEKSYNDEQFNDDEKGTRNEKFFQYVKDEIIKAIAALQKITKFNGSIDKRYLFSPSLDDHKRETMDAQVNGSTTTLDDVALANKLDDDKVKNNGHLMKMKDLIDKLNLTFLYDQSRSVLKTYNSLYGLDLKTVRQHIDNINQNQNNQEVIDSEKEWLLDYAKQNLDLTSISEKDLLDWATEGTKGKLENPNNMFNRMPMYGKGKKQLVKNDWKNAISKNAEKMEQIKAMKLQSLVDSYMQHVYGLDFTVPTTPFVQGNTKLPSTSLVINFTSAHGCPSWNECLVKHACYARTSEHGYSGLWAKNDNLQMMWEGSKYDGKIKKALRQMIRFHVVSIASISSAFAKITSDNGVDLRTEFLNRYHGGDNEEFSNLYNDSQYFKNATKSVDPTQNITSGTWNSLSNTVSKNKKGRYKSPNDLFCRTVYIALKNSENGFLDVFNEREREIIKNTKGCLRVTHIRLNEEGDYIGQWLLNDMDEFAEELKTVGCQMVCYTCRFLNYDGIKNIVINASQQSIGGTKDSMNPNINRYFFAVTEDFYNHMEETYGGVDENGNVIDANMPTLVNPSDVRPELRNKYFESLSDETKGKIIPLPKELYGDDGKPTGRLYYKCPCGRGKVQKMPSKDKDETEEEYNNKVARFKLFHAVNTYNKDNSGKDIQRQRMGDKDITSSEAINCYECNVCYSMKEGLSKGMVVLVQVHSANKDDFRGMQAMEKHIDKNQEFSQPNKDIYSGDFEQRWNDKQSILKNNPSLANGLSKKFSKNKNESFLRSSNNGLITEINDLFDFNDNTKQDEAFDQITKNAIFSVNEHLKGLTNSITEQRNIRKTFNENYKRFFNRLI